MIEKLSSELDEKLSKEYELFIQKVKKLPIENVIAKAKEITLKEEFKDLSYDNYDKYSLKYLLEQDNTLDYLFDSWEENNFSFDEEIDMRIDIILHDYIDKYRNNIISKIKLNPHYELINDISNSLQSFNSNDFCINLKRNFGVKDLDLYDTSHILESKDGIRYLISYFEEMKDNEHLSYCIEIGVVDSQSYNNIDEKILPELNKLMKYQEKNVNENKREEGRDSR